MKDEDLQIFEEAFQFLIGRLRTDVRITGTITLKEFQFLIGRLRTVTGTFARMNRMGVSIPHR